jgi:hypothetical protein
MAPITRRALEEDALIADEFIEISRVGQVRSKADNLATASPGPAI